MVGLIPAAFNSARDGKQVQFPPSHGGSMHFTAKSHRTGRGVHPLLRPYSLGRDRSVSLGLGASPIGGMQGRLKSWNSSTFLTHSRGVIEKQQ